MAEKPTLLNVTPEMDRIVETRFYRMDGAGGWRSGSVKTCNHFNGAGWVAVSEVRGKLDDDAPLMESGASKILLCDQCSGVVFRVLDWGLPNVKDASGVEAAVL